MNEVIVLGQGYVGLPVAMQVAKAGFKVFGFDIDPDKITKLNNGVTDSPDVDKDEILDLKSQGKIEFTAQIPRTGKPTIYIITVPTPLKNDRTPDLTMLENACKLIASVVDDDSLIINESTSYIGTLRNLIKPIIENNSGKLNLKFAVAPERIDPGNLKWGITNTPRNISGLSQSAIDETIKFYSKFCLVVREASQPEVVEAAKLFENTFRQVNIALVNEFSQIAKEFNFTAHEAIELAGSKPFGFMPFYPGIGVGGHCIPVDPSYLVYSANISGVDPKIITTANEVNNLVPVKVANRIKGMFGNNLQGKRIQLAGMSYKANISDLRESPSLILMTELKKLGAIVTWFDPLIDSIEGHKSVQLDPTVDLGLIITPHDSMDFSIWSERGTQVIDLSSTTKNYGWPKFL